MAEIVTRADYEVLEEVAGMTGGLFVPADKGFPDPDSTLTTFVRVHRDFKMPPEAGADGHVKVCNFLP